MPVKRFEVDNREGVIFEKADGDYVLHDDYEDLDYRLATATLELQRLQAIIKVAKNQLDG